MNSFYALLVVCYALALMPYKWDRCPGDGSAHNKSPHKIGIGLVLYIKFPKWREATHIVCSDIIFRKLNDLFHHSSNRLHENGLKLISNKSNDENVQREEKNWKGKKTQKYFSNEHPPIIPIWTMFFFPGFVFVPGVRARQSHTEMRPKRPFSFWAVVDEPKGIFYTTPMLLSSS